MPTTIYASTEPRESSKTSGVERFDPTRHREDAIRLGEMMYLEGGYTDFNPDKFLAFLDQPHVYASIYRHAALGYIGGMVGYVAPPMFGQGALVAKDLGVFIHPAHRGSMAAVRLVRDFEAWAREKGAAHVLLAQSTGINVERTRQWYEAMGYTVYGYLTKRTL